MTYLGTQESQKCPSSTQRWEPVQLRSFLECWGWVLPWREQDDISDALPWISVLMTILTGQRSKDLDTSVSVYYSVTFSFCICHKCDNRSWETKVINLSLLWARQCSSLCLLQCFTIERLGRRPLMIGGFFFMGLCCFGITLTILFQVWSHMTPRSSWPSFS